MPLCPRCGGQMDLYIEVDVGNPRIVNTVYVCRVCRLRVYDSAIIIAKSSDGGVRIEAYEFTLLNRVRLNRVR